MDEVRSERVSQGASEIAVWLREIDEDYLEAWASRGLLRRGRKLLSAGPADCVVDEDHCQASLDGHQQRLSAAGFEHLTCSCPAIRACHHAVAFLLCLRKHPALSTDNAGVEIETVAATPPWLIESLEALEKQLGKTHLRRARRLLLQAVEIELAEGANGLVAHINDGALHTVRIPCTTGLSGSICSCTAERCVHRAVAVLSARIRAGMSELTDDLDDALTPDQLNVLGQLCDWLRELVAQGTAGISRTTAEQGEALATVARQADFPALAGSLSGLVKLQYDELAGRSFISAADFRARLAPLWGRLAALRSTPLPQPLSRLAGEHKRHYNLVSNLGLLGVGAEVWRSPGDYLGLTLHLYAPENGRWYRYTQARRADQTNDGWSPEGTWKNGVWAGGVTCNKIPGGALRLRKCWVSGDGQLSGRDGTLIELAESRQQTAGVDDCFVSLRQRYSCLAAENMLGSYPTMPAVIQAQRADQPVFDTVEQRWSQRLQDSKRNELQLELLLLNHYDETTRANLDRLWSEKHRWQQIFGFVSYRDGHLVMRPVSVCTEGVNQWIHLTLQ